jgi:hypothetical protein
MDEELAEAARAIRPYLGELVGDAAARFDSEIADLLEAAGSGHDVMTRLWSLLTSTAATESWTAEVLSDPLHRPPPLQSAVRRGYEPLPGVGAPVPASKYTCPHGDYIWYRPATGMPVPRCPTHDSVLDLVPT